MAKTTSFVKETPAGAGKPASKAIPILQPWRAEVSDKEGTAISFYIEWLGGMGTGGRFF